MTIRRLSTETLTPSEIGRVLRPALHERFAEPMRQVQEIVDRVRAEGYGAVLEYARRFDTPDLTAADLEVSRAEIEAAFASAADEHIAAIRRACDSVRRFHAHRVPQSWEHTFDGATLGQRVLPLDRVGIYVPALAFGTESIPRVDKVVGPGSIYVLLAKRAVFGHVGIESLPGPSDVLIIADEEQEPSYVAADLLSQAEHGAESSSVLVTPSAALADAVERELGRQLAALPRRDEAKSSLAGRGALVLCRDLDEAADVANAVAPEHLEVLVSGGEDALLSRDAGPTIALAEAEGLHAHANSVRVRGF